ncbi:MAG TPA: CapA family protein [Acidimicrobiia bacterium]|nr:CapA family protein [Acidimicrobiia bacterium]
MNGRDGTVARVSFLGDTLVGGEAQAVLDTHSPDWAFDGFRHVLASSDLVVANHEGPITNRNHPASKLDTGRKRYWYRALPSAIPALAAAGIRVVSLGNNHVLDFGSAGLLDTIEELDRAGIAHCGAGANRSAARKPAIVEINGLRLGFVSFMQRYDVYLAERLYAGRDRPGPLLLKSDRMRRDIEKLRASVDWTVALVHWGRNYRKRNPRQRRLAREIRAAGAGMIVGHHPHVPQRISVQSGVPVCYSLGNGPLGTPGRFHSGRLPYGLVVTVDLDEGARVRRLQVTALHVDNSQVAFQPRVAGDTASIEMLRSLVAKQLDWRECDGGLAAEVPRARSPLRVPEPPDGVGEVA